MYTLLAFLVLRAEWASRKELTCQQLKKELLSSLFCQFNKQNCGHILFCVLLITGECEHFQNHFGCICFSVLYILYSYMLIIEEIIASLLKCKPSLCSFLFLIVTHSHIFVLQEILLFCAFKF